MFEKKNPPSGHTMPICGRRAGTFDGAVATRKLPNDLPLGNLSGLLFVGPNRTSSATPLQVREERSRGEFFFEELRAGEGRKGRVVQAHSLSWQIFASVDSNQRSVHSLFSFF